MIDCLDLDLLIQNKAALLAAYFNLKTVFITAILRCTIVSYFTIIYHLHWNKFLTVFVSLCLPYPKNCLTQNPLTCSYELPKTYVQKPQRNIYPETRTTSCFSCVSYVETNHRLNVLRPRKQITV